VLTPEGRARALAHFFVERGILPEAALSIALVDGIELAIAAAVLEEREACAALAADLGEAVEVGPGGDCVQGCRGVAEEIAAAIRARGRPPC